MKLCDLLNNYQFHDSLLKNIVYSSATSILIIYLELGNYNQPSYKKGDPELILCKLILNNVKKYSLISNSENFNFDEILQAKILKTKTGDVLEMVLRGDNDVKVIEIQSDNVELKIIENLQ